jgi:hypothetical protein
MAATMRLIGGGAVMLVAAALFALGVPRLVAAFVSLPASPILGRMQDLKAVDAKSLKILITTQQRGLKWHETSRRWTDLGFTQILLANKSGAGKERDALLGKAEISLRTGLALAPSNSFAWTRLAYIDMETGGPSPSMARKLRMAVARAPYNRRLVFPRLRLIFIAWPKFEKAERSMILDQTRFAWRLNAYRLTKMAADQGRVGLVQAALFRTPEKFSKFENLLKAYRRKSG